MADPKQLEILRKGVKTWNHSRQKNPLLTIDLTKADLSLADLTGANLKGANLRRANLTGANLRRADLSQAILSQADLSQAVLRRADLRRADLSQADLSQADLSQAILSQADLTSANLTNADLFLANLSFATLESADLQAARIGHTHFHHIFSLHLAKNLHIVQHIGPSYIDRHTLQHSIHALPNIFLEGCGYTQNEIEYLRAMYRQGIQFYSVFISRAATDEEFAERLVADLRAKNVSCWHYTQDMRGGADWEDQVNQAIKVHEKLLLVCSSASVYRPQVVKEIYAAIDEERKTGIQKLFPIRLDDHILTDEMLTAGLDMAKIAGRMDNWVSIVRKKHIADFTGWKHQDAYKTEFDKLLRDLTRDP